MTLHLKTKNTPTHTFFYIATQPDVGSFPGCSCPTSLIPCRSLNIPHPRPSGPVNVHFDSQAPSHPSRFSFSSCLSFLIFSRATLFPVHGFGNVWPPEEFICPNPSLCPSTVKDVPQTSICQDSCKTKERLDVFALKLED